MEMSTSISNITSQTTSRYLPNLKWDITKLPFRALYYDCMDFIAAVYLPLLTFGITANILNIVLYAKSKLRDNITVSFLALSTSDLIYLVLLSPHLIVKVIQHFVNFRLGISVKWLIDPQILRYPFYWYAFVFYETSILINVYISVVRCACVAIPFKVKSTFTARRAVIAFVAFFLSVFLLRIPMFMKKRIVQEFDPISNVTRVVYKEAEDGGLAESMNDIVSRNILNWASFVTVIVCLVIMITKLQTSVRFRSSNALRNPQPLHTTTNSDNDKFQSSQRSDPGKTEIVLSDVNPPDNQNSMANNSSHQFHSCQTKQSDAKARQIKDESCPEISQTKTLKDKSPASERGQHKGVHTREAQIVRSVILVAVIFVTCQTPLMTYTLARRFESQFDDQDDLMGGNVQKYVFLFAVCSNISLTFTLINASINIIVYYNFNSRYRQSIKNLWKGQPS